MKRYTVIAILGLTSLCLLFVSGIVTARNSSSEKPESIMSKLDQLKKNERSSGDIIDSAAKLNYIDTATKDKIQTKQRQMINEEPALRQSLASKTHEERLEIIQQKQNEIFEWERQNNVPTGYLIVLNPFN